MKEGYYPRDGQITAFLFALVVLVNPVWRACWRGWSPSGQGGHSPGAEQATPGMQTEQEKLLLLKNTLLPLKVHKSSRVYF